MIGRGDAEIARVAAAQKGLVVREQLVAAGLARGAIAHRLAQRRLHEVYRGVYLVGHTVLAPLALEMGAVLYHRGYAVLSHRTAAVVWGLLDRSDGNLMLTVAGKDRRSRPGMELFRVAGLDRRDLRARDGVPLTAPARTVLDLAARASASELEYAIAQLRVRGLLRDDELRAAIARAPGRTGAGTVARLLERADGAALTRSAAERRLIDLIRAARLPTPETNAHLCGYEVDFLWRRERLVVEVDGYAFHGHRAAFERDRKRDRALAAAGYRVIRVTWRQLQDEPFAVIAEIALALRTRAT